MNDILKKLENIGLVPVVKIDDASHACNLAQSLIDGGLPCVEITFRTAAAPEAISAIVKIPKMLVGAGTVINIDYAKRKRSRCKIYSFAGFSPDVVDWCIKNNMIIIPVLIIQVE